MFRSGRSRFLNFDGFEFNRDVRLDRLTAIGAAHRKVNRGSIESGLQFMSLTNAEADPSYQSRMPAALLKTGSDTDEASTRKTRGKQKEYELVQESNTKIMFVVNALCFRRPRF